MKKVSNQELMVTYPYDYVSEFNDNQEYRVVNQVKGFPEGITKKALIDASTGQIIFNFDEYDYVRFYPKSQVYCFVKEDDEDSQDLKRRVTVSLFDSQQKKIIAFNWKAITSNKCTAESYLLRDPNDEMYHLFNDATFRNHPEEFNHAYQSVTFNDDRWILKDEKGSYWFDLYHKQLVNLPFDEIQLLGLFKLPAVLKKDNQQYILFPDLHVSQNYKRVQLDSNDRHFLYGYDSSGKINVHAYNFEHQNLFQMDADEISYVPMPEAKGEEKKNFYFIFRRGSKYGLVCYRPVVTSYDEKQEDCQWETVLCVPGEMDSIHYDSDGFHLMKDNKVGFYSPASSYDSKEFYVEPKYDKMFLLNHNRFCFQLDDTVDIYQFSPEFCSTRLSNAKICELNPFVFQDEQSFGLLSFDGTSIDLIRNRDAIQYLGQEYFLVSKDEKYGIDYENCSFISPKYDSIDVFFPSKGFSSAIFFLNKDGEIQVKMIGDKIERSKYAHARLLSDFIVLWTKGKNQVVLKDYYGNTLKRIKTTPDEIEQLDQSITEIGNHYYSVQSKPYHYSFNFSSNKRDLCEVDSIQTFTSPFYVTAYEGENGTVVVNERTLYEHDRVCQMIESMSEDEFEDRLKQMNSKPRVYRKVVKK